MTRMAAGAPHIPAQTSVQKVMAQVLLALLPGILAYMYYFGVGILVQITLALLFAYTFEYLSLSARQQPLRKYLCDLSAAVTAVLFALSLPPLAPWWCSLIGMLFAIVIAKHLFGGLGQNRFNPAMVGLAVLLISFPRIFTHWSPPTMLVDNPLSMLEVLRTIFTTQPPPGMSWDAITQATPLDQLRTGAATGLLVTEVRQGPVFGHFGGLGWEWIANWYALGGLWLLWRRVIHWRVPVAVLLTTFMLTTPFYLFDPDANPLPLQHIFSGATVFVAFFIATDPVSGSATPRGQLLFGAGVAIIMLAIRRWGVYPDGVAFAILVMNMFAPLLDQYTRPRVFGHPR
ncbi:MAG: RnfABCDGE type electron transport complex subunit D [Gammaproteobacteria bacterium]|jgi:electron transport complex protein RnfD|nr:RnfABCDGE type electron transport complex subunit D [Gammaproteobacteria bacterium]